MPESIVVELADGSRTEYTKEQYIAEFGEEAFRDLTEVIPLSEMSPKDRALAERMQSEGEVNAVLGELDIDNLDDFPHEFDHDGR